MFTGLIQDLGEITAAEKRGGDAFFTIRTGIDLASEKIGASICCSGCCLTVLEKGADWFKVEVSAESLSKTAIGAWDVGTKINIEPSLRVGSELGGHFVFGHVDGLVEIVSITPEGESHRFIIKPPP